MNPSRVGLIGIGLLGSALGERLLGAGFHVTGADSDSARGAMIERIGGRIGSARGVALECDRVVLCLPTSEVVAQVVAEIEPVLRAGQIVIDTTTGAPDAAASMGRRLAERGVAYLDATISGSSDQARAGDVVVTAGGEREAFEGCRDLFDAFARRAFHVGPCGAGSAIKLASNLVLGLNRAALAEGLAFARALGMNLDATLEVFREGAAYSRIMDAKGPKMLRGDFTPQARLSQHLKDVRLILDEARRAGASTPLSAVHQQLLEAAEAAGCGDLDNRAIIRAYERHNSSA
jgi:3-hydroxyisobutyrate dehydrogenase-like beta-hydroxyacid dehydrogenase